ncbi:MAG: hypothetical protein P8J49_02340 [SAR324 cluster bacterium]|nr:hypothetical protein [SAR324 cluster bacterium]
MPASNRHRPTRRILIVDDIEDNCLLIEDHLQSQLKCEFRKASYNSGGACSDRGVVREG